jgi:calcium-dependent protein kinase
MIGMITIQMLNNKDEAEYASLFRYLDRDFDGVISKAELEAKLHGKDYVTNDDIEGIMKKYDTNRDGSITYTEFLTMSINWKQKLDPEEVETLLKYFDIVRKRALTRKELENLFEGVPEKEWKKFFDDYDENKDGLISVDELKSYFRMVVENL